MEQVGSQPPVIGWLEGDGALVVAQGVLEGCRRHGLLPGQRQVVNRLLRVGGGSRLVEVVGKVGGVLLQGAGIDLLHRLGHAQVHALAPGEGK